MTAIPPGRTQVLLIDDDEVIAGSLRHYLVRQGCDVDLAVEPAAAETLMTSRQYDVVLVDPYLTGAIHGDNGELLGSIGTLQPGASTIVLTAYVSPELARAAEGCHSARLLAKPQSVIFLSELVASAPRSGRPRTDP